ncbi:alpha/beta fold hydrolase [Williamsia serinedens]|uniref:Pimeloyl-ACP methyl ester carboxylesterase n=1 Tax=Williamsia serinedens TaxID=391736 RepID=A0ABT1H6K7_9NOCA|nr:alpha/beta fold hydrolase [Williamsia serinedens]MCP2162872.1 Pimeloyl-ACP methyl ester carboxylesterase [Williamsia serinedens]
MTGHPAPAQFTSDLGPIPYRVAGPDDPSAPTAVLVHGVLADGRLWSHVVDRLVDRGVRCVVPDLPLGAHSTAMDAGAPLSPRSVAAAIAGLLAHLDLSDVTLVGNDTGGALCQFLLATDPSRVGQVVFTNCDAFDVFPPRPFREVFALLQRPAILRAMIPTMRLTALRHSPLGYGLLAHGPDSALTRSWIDPLLSSSAIRRDLVTFLRAIDPAELDGVTRSLTFDGPVALAWGSDDRCFTPDLGRRLAGVFPDAEFTPVPDARTFVPLDAPDAVADAVVAVARRSAARS